MAGYAFFRGQGSYLFFSLLCTLVIIISASEAPAAPPPPEGEIRSLIIGVITKEEKPAQAEAKKRAQDRSLEKARNRLGELRKAGLDFELVRRSPGGFVTILSQKEVRTEKAARPHFWFETEAEFVLKDMKTGKSPDTALLDRADLLDCRIWTDKKEYREGQTVTLNLQGNRDFHAKIVQITAKGQILQILPNNYRQISVFEKDKPYRLPAEGDRYQMIVKPPFGTVRFVAYATRRPMSQVNLKTIGGGIYEYRSSLKNFGRSVRRIIPAGEELLTEFSEVAWAIKTLPRASAP